MSSPSGSDEKKVENMSTEEQKLENAENIEIPAQKKPPKAEKPEELRFFKTKKIRFGPIDYQIVTQNVNGPCPLIALVNALVLKGKLEIPRNYAINSTDLLNLLTNLILSRVPTSEDVEIKETYENNLRDVLEVLPKIVNGLDVNVKFSGVDQFEFTPELSLFDLVSVNLYHVWLPDPQFTVVYDLVTKLNYNELVEKMFLENDEAQLLQNFHEESISQITFHGLATLLETMKDGELAVVFHNNHFATILKRRDEIFKLVSDEGLADEPNVIWETFNSCDGDCIFVNADFGNFKAAPPEEVKPSPVHKKESSIEIIPNPSEIGQIEVGIEALERPSSVPIPSQGVSMVRSRTEEPIHPQTARNTEGFGGFNSGTSPQQRFTPRREQKDGKSCNIM